MKASLYLEGTPKPETRELRRVLVLGNGSFATKIVQRLVQNGRTVLHIDGKSEGQADNCSAGETAWHIKELRGFVGSFEVVLASPAGMRKENVGSVIVIPPVIGTPLFGAYGLERSERVVSLSELEAVLTGGGPLPTKRGDWMHIVFLCGLAEETDPAIFARVMNVLETLNQQELVQTYVCMRNAKVAAPGLERQYRRTREQGTIYFKFDDAGPVFEQQAGGVTLIFRDPLLGQEMELVPDLLVVDEVLGGHAPQAVLDVIPSSPAFAPFLQPESLRFIGIETPKVGILAVGPSRGVFLPALIENDVDTAMTSIQRMDSQVLRSAAATVPTVDPAKCTVCLTCVRLCPHGAMGFTDAAYVDPASCVRCGICAAECPMEAITSPAPSKEEIGASVGRSSGELSKIVAFLCYRSGLDAWEATPPSLKEHVVPLVVPCAGAVSEARILQALAHGAAGVVVAGCFTGNCASIYGTLLAQARIDKASRFLCDSGLDTTRIRFVSTASNTGPILAQVIQELLAKSRTPRKGPTS